MHQQLHAPTVACTNSCMHQPLHAPTVACTNSCMHQQLHAPTVACTNSCMHQQLHAPTVACTNSCMHQQLHAPTVACTNSCMHQQLHAPTVACRSCAKCKSAFWFMLLTTCWMFLGTPFCEQQFIFKMCFCLCWLPVGSLLFCGPPFVHVVFCLAVVSLLLCQVCVGAGRGAGAACLPPVLRPTHRRGLHGRARHVSSHVTEPDPVGHRLPLERGAQIQTHANALSRTRGHTKTREHKRRAPRTNAQMNTGARKKRLHTNTWHMIRHDVTDEYAGTRKRVNIEARTPRTSAHMNTGARKKNTVAHENMAHDKAWRDRRICWHAKTREHRSACTPEKCAHEHGCTQKKKRLHTNAWHDKA